MSENCTHDCSSCGEECPSRQNPESFLAPMNKMSNVKKVIGVVSGKGGVGKSLVTSMLAVTMQRRGFKTAILDADITGPSIPKCFGIHEKAMGSDDGLFPVNTKTGIETMSINELLPDETSPVVWRGRSSPVSSSSSGATSSGMKSIICLLICPPEPATHRSRCSSPSRSTASSSLPPRRSSSP